MKASLTDMKFKLLNLVFLSVVAIAAVIEPNLSANTSTNFLASSNVEDYIYSNIYRAATYAALSYCTKYDDILLGNLKQACPCRLCYDSKDGIFVEHIYKGKVSAVVFRDDNLKEIIFAIKGTTTNHEWIMDFKIMPIPYHSLSKRKKGWSKFWKFNSKCKGCTIHKGFYDGSKIIYDNVFDKVLQLLEEYNEYNLIVTGHSLGGALAPIIANEFLLLKKDVNVVTFGAPKIGNSLFSKWMDKAWNTLKHYDDVNSMFHSNSYVRVTHKSDIVPLLPKRQMGYKHSGINVYFDKNEEPMTVENIKIKSSSFENLTEQENINENEENSKSIEYTEDLTKPMDSHRVYLIRMNQCRS